MDDLLLARHRLIDQLLEQAVASGGVTDVIEVAAGFSGRGLRFVERWPALSWAEVDLPVMASAKAAALERAGLSHPRLRVLGLDALEPGGFDQLGLDGTTGVAVTTEGLLSYLSLGHMLSLWRSIGGLLARGGPGSIYLPELHTRAEVPVSRLEGGFRLGLGAFTRGRVTVHHRDRQHAEEDLAACGLEVRSWHSGAEAHSHPSAAMVNVAVCRAAGAR